MPLSPEDVSHVAMLARLGLTEEEQELYGAQLDAILDHIGRLQAVDTAHVAETAQVGGLVNAWREDEPAPPMGADRALANAPDREGAHFRVGAIQE